MTVPSKTTSEWTLWVVAASCALHVTEEYFTGWQEWALETLGIVMPTARFLVANSVLVVAALFLAHIGWRRPTLSLVIPAATLVNAIFHILSTVKLCDKYKAISLRSDTSTSFNGSLVWKYGKRSKKRSLAAR